MKVMTGNKSRFSKFISSGRYVDYTFLLPAVLFMAIFMLYPVGYNLVISLKDVTLQNYIQGEQHFIGFANFQTIFADKYFWSAFENTFVFVFLSLIFQFVIGMAFALFFNLPFKGNKWMRAIVLIAWMNPSIITGEIFKWLMSGDIGFLNYALMNLGVVAEPIQFLTNTSTALASVIAANIWVGVPFNMVILISGLQGISNDVYESAVIDGAGFFRKFRSITMPMLRPTILVLLLLGFIYTFKVFDIIYVMTSGGPANASQILPYYSYEKSFVMFRFGEGAAASCISFGIIAVLAAIYLYFSKKEEIE